MKRIAVVGASGFVGSAIVERLLTHAEYEVLPFIHSSGNAMRLARRGIELGMLNLLDTAQLESQLAGVTHVINCSRGDDHVMLTGLKNLLAASRRNRVRRFVHLSSVAVYGDPPPPESVHEIAPTNPKRGSYGWIKLLQDKMVKDAAQSGLSSIVLCPPNISGPHSYFLVSLVDALRSGRFGLLEDGTAPCNLVDVSNLSHAIELALDNGPADGARMFVTDDEPTDWRCVVDGVMPLLQPGGFVRRITREELCRIPAANASPPISLGRSMKHLVSSDVREAMRKDPLWEKVDVALRKSVTLMGKAVENKLRHKVEGPMKVAKAASELHFDAGLCRQQLRGVTHTCELAKAQLGYEPIYSVPQSMQAFRSWYSFHHGMDGVFWPLLRQLH